MGVKDGETHARHMQPFVKISSGQTKNYLKILKHFPPFFTFRSLQNFTVAEKAVYAMYACPNFLFW